MGDISKGVANTLQPAKTIHKNNHFLVINLDPEPNPDSLKSLDPNPDSVILDTDFHDGFLFCQIGLIYF